MNGFLGRNVVNCSGSNKTLTLKENKEHIVIKEHKEYLKQPCILSVYASYERISENLRESQRI